VRLIRCLTAEGTTTVGVRTDQGVIPTGYSSMMEFIRDGDVALEAARSAEANGTAIVPAKVLAPMVDPGKMLFLGMTYDVFRQNVTIEQEPYVYARVQSSIIGPDEAIRVPSPEAHLLYEGELVVVIGKPMYKVKAAEAMDYIFGYTQANDVTWTQWVHGTTTGLPQISMSKNADTFCPLGPDVVTADSLDPVNLGFTVTVNGEVRTNESTKGMAWSIAQILEFLSTDMTLWPGDLVSTGTCEAKDIVAGDHVVVEFDGLGKLENPVVGSWE
jgi:2-keto-4-pentenoate hydratase/2-oxohepta-3-ene-1,7-dioic acid hydratase in catechol pathway